MPNSALTFSPGFSFLHYELLENIYAVASVRHWGGCHPGRQLRVSPLFFPDKMATFFQSSPSLPVLRLKNWRPFLLITVTFYWFCSGVTAWKASPLTFFTCPTAFVHYFFVNLPTIFFPSDPGRSAPSPLPSDATEFMKTYFTLIRNSAFAASVNLDYIHCTWRMSESLKFCCWISIYLYCKGHSLSQTAKWQPITVYRRFGHRHHSTQKYRNKVPTQHLPNFYRGSQNVKFGFDFQPDSSISRNASVPKYRLRFSDDGTSSLVFKL